MPFRHLPLVSFALIREVVKSAGGALDAENTVAAKILGARNFLLLHDFADLGVTSAFLKPRPLVRSRFFGTSCAPLHCQEPGPSRLA